MRVLSELPKRVLIVFILALCAVAGLVLAAYVRVTTLDAVVTARARSYENVQNLEVLQTLVVDMETGHRGFEISGDEEFLAPYQAAKSKFDEVYRGLRKNLEPSEDTVLSDLKPLIEKQFVLTDSAIARKRSRRSINVEEARVLKSTVDQIRTQIALLKTNEANALRARIEQARSDILFNRFALPIGGAIAGALVAAAILMVTRESEKSRVQSEELNKLRDEAVEASKLKSAFLANMSHEIRTPMNGVLGLAEILQKTELNADQKTYVDSIQRSAVSLLSLINGILDLSKIESGKLDLENTYFEIESVVNEAISTVEYAAKTKGVGIQKSIDTQAPRAFNGDPTRIRQILINLLNNAVKFTERGAVNFTLKSIGKKEEKTQLEFIIRDEGIGMSDETQARLFSAFSQADESTTRKFGGTGLGLSIVKELVNLMKGSVEIESELNKGTTVKVVLPLTAVPVAKKVSAAQTKKTQAKVPESERLKILVVEDNAINQQVVRGMLSNLGHQAAFAGNGVEALEKIEQDQFELILMDCQMPVMDGFEATREIRKKGQRAIPIIAVTASAVRGDLENCLIAGMNDFISKPMTISDLSSKIDLWSPKASRISNQVLAPRPESETVQMLSRDEQQALQKLFTEMALRFDAREFPELAEAARKLKTLSADLGLVRLRGLAQSIESGWQTAELQALEFKFLTLSIEYDLVLRHLARLEVTA